MGRCSVEKLQDLRGALEVIRKWPEIREPRPGIFYVKREPFLHFHEKDTSRWADIKTNGEFVSHDIPFEASSKQIAAFLKTAKSCYLELA